MELEKKYNFVKNNKKRAVYISFLGNICGSFSIYSNKAVCRCHDPPSVNFKKIDRRKRKCQREIKVKIIHIH